MPAAENSRVVAAYKKDGNRITVFTIQITSIDYTVTALLTGVDVFYPGCAANGKSRENIRE